jgi:hypothetical protein
MGFARNPPLSAIGPFLATTARIGVLLAIVTGLALFSVQPAKYAVNAAFLAKIGIVALAIANAVIVDFSAAWHATIAGNEVAARLRWQAAASSILWIAALVAGRWIGFL